MSNEKHYLSTKYRKTLIFVFIVFMSVIKVLSNHIIWQKFKKSQISSIVLKKCKPRLTRPRQFFAKKICNFL